RRSFTRLEPWLADLLNTLHSLADQLPSLDEDGTPADGGVILTGAPSVLASSAMAGLSSNLSSLARAPSPQPANSLRLARTVERVFSPMSDSGPRLISALRPAVAPLLYSAWANLQPPPTSAPILVFALRAKTAPFGNNAPLQTIVPAPATGSPPT